MHSFLRELRNSGCPKLPIRPRTSLGASNAGGRGARPSVSSIVKRDWQLFDPSNRLRAIAAVTTWKDVLVRTRKDLATRTIDTKERYMAAITREH